MNILIVDGNEKEASDKYREIGIDTQYEIYSKILKKIANFDINIKIIHPAVEKNYLPKGLGLDDFHGIAWTGSLLNIYDNTSSISRQIDLAKNLMEKNNKIFGSCWGLQVCVTAAGGKIRKNPKGLEAIIARDISLSKDGISHPMYSGKSDIFDSFCWHYDETETIPENSKILASNNISSVQALSFTKKKSEIWAVQYHPEFDPLWMSNLMTQRKKILIDNNVYKDQKEFDSYYKYLSNIKKYDNMKKKLNIKENLLDHKMHSLELINWIKLIKHKL